MCCCEKPTINGNYGYCWNTPGERVVVYPVNPPAVEEGKAILFDEPGRCGGLDAHSHHYRVIPGYLLVRHGGGDERVRLSNSTAVVKALAGLDSNARYWMLSAIFNAHHDGQRDGTLAEGRKWCNAAQEKRIKTRKQRGSGYIKVWIEKEEEVKAA